jgi:hypothetical protein
MATLVYTNMLTTRPPKPLLFLDSLFPKTDISYMRTVRGKMEDGKMRKRTWEAAGWPWGWERMLSFEGGVSGLRYVEEPFWKRLWTCRQTMNE